MTGRSAVALLSVAALVASVHAAKLPLQKQVRTAKPACASGPTLPFSNPDDCSTYYQCIGVGSVQLLNCPSGLEFSSADHVCEYPAQAKCSASSSSGGADTPSDNSGQGSDHKPNNNGDSSSLPDCPYPADPNVVVHFPNPEDCGSFYKCGLDGQPALIPCQEGLEWNAEAEYCDYPENAQCSVSSGNDGGDDKPPADTDDGNDDEPADNDDSGSSDGSSPLPECPYPADPNVVVHFPNPQDCSSFYKCGLDGKPVLIPCQEGLEWNAEAEYCDYPQNAKCSVSSGSSANKPAGSGNAGSSSASSPLPECPLPADPDVVVQFPNPDDCGSFYKCDNDGEPVLTQCPAGLEWNAEAEYCDYPANAGCSVSSGNSASEGKPKPGSDGKPGHSSSNAGSSVPECPFPADPDVVVHFPNPEDCGSFYKCGLDGVPVLIECPDGLEWNAEAEVCDYPASAGCSVSEK